MFSRFLNNKKKSLNDSSSLSSSLLSNQAQLHDEDNSMRIDQLQPFLYHDYGLEEEEEETEVDGNGNNNNTQRRREGTGSSSTGTSPHYHHYYTGTNSTLITRNLNPPHEGGSGIGIAGEIITTQTRNQHYRNQIMRFIAYIILLSAMFMGIVGIPYLTWHSFHHSGKRIDFIALYSAGLITVFTLVVSVYQIYMHLTHFVMPDPQKYVVRILFMVPFYSVQSYLSLLFFRERLYTDTLRDLYEAFTISSFLYLMIELLGGEENISQILDQKREHNNHNTQQQQNNNNNNQTHKIGQHHFPFNLCLPEWKMGSHYLLECKYGTLQYVVIKVFTTISTLFLHPLGLYNEGLFSMRDSYIYMVVIINFSQCYALYCLVMFYHVLENDLRHPKNWYPLGKFICVKGVVFFTWWQGLGLTILQNRGVFDIFLKENGWSPDTVAVFLQDYLIVAEMFLFAVAHHFFFSYKEYQNNNDLSSLLLSSSFSSSGAGAGVGRVGAGLGDTHTHTATIRTLNNPMSMKEAFWNSSVPTETFDDIQRLRRGAQRVVTEHEKNEQQNFGGIALMNIKNAESI